MQGSLSPKRFTESLSGRMASFLLILIAFVSMATSTNMVYSHVPEMLGLGLVVLLALYGLLRGYRFPRLSMMSYGVLAAGGYFFWRASSSYSQLEGANDMALVLNAAVFYVAGMYYGLSKKGDAVFAFVLLLGLIINAAYWYFARYCDLGQIWWLRADVGLLGASSKHAAFFLYKNVACAFFLAAGWYLMSRCFWLASWSWVRALGFVLGLAAVVLSFFCSSRVVYALLPLLLVVSWGLGIVLRVRSGKHIRWFDYFFILGCVVALFGFIYDCAGQQIIWGWIDGVDTHLRFDIWAYLMQVVPQASWFGYGSGASQWEIVPIYSEWSSPNRAHNEYLQMWVDYGLVGLGLLLLLLCWHVFRAVVSLCDGGLALERRVQVAGALMMLLALAGYAFVDFPWHHFSVLSLTAFLGGILASPRGEELRIRQFFAAAGSRVALLRPQTKLLVGFPRCLFAAVLVLVSVGVGDLLLRYAPVWRANWDYNNLVATQAPAEEKMELLERVIRIYPESDILSWYRQHPYARTQEGYQHLSDLTQLCLQANPKNLFLIANLSDLWSRVGKFEDAEYLLRENYGGDGLNGTMLGSWPTYYGMNLLRWADALYKQNRWRQSYSMSLYAYRINCQKRFAYTIAWRTNLTQDMEEHKKNQLERNKLIGPYMKKLLKRIKFFKRVGVEPDDSWKQAMRSGGPQSLYKNWGEMPSKHEK